MDNREDLAKRLVAHSRWVWLEGMEVRWFRESDKTRFVSTVGCLDVLDSSFPWEDSDSEPLLVLDHWGTKGILLGIAWEGLGPLTIGRASGTKPGQISVAGTTVGRCLGACADTLEEALADIILQWWEGMGEGDAGETKIE